jgi:hypothetical protein
MPLPIEIVLSDDARGLRGPAGLLPFPMGAAAAGAADALPLPAILMPNETLLNTAEAVSEYNLI